MARKQRDVLSVEWIKLELIRTAYATRGGLFSTMDPRMVLLWYLIMAVAPWFTHNLTVLAIFFAMGVVAVILARVGPLLLALFVFGLLMETVYIFVAALFFGGDLNTVLALAEFTLKLGAISMASMAAFVSLDPEKLSDALLSLKAPPMLAFAVSYGYRMLPILVEEFNTVFDNYRLRSAPPDNSSRRCAPHPSSARSSALNTRRQREVASRSSATLSGSSISAAAAISSVRRSASTAGRSTSSA